MFLALFYFYFVLFLDLLGVGENITSISRVGRYGGETSGFRRPLGLRLIVVMPVIPIKRFVHVLVAFCLLVISFHFTVSKCFHTIHGTLLINQCSKGTGVLPTYSALLNDGFIDC